MRTKNTHRGIYSILFPQNEPRPAEHNLRDLIFLCVDTGHLLVVDWQDAREADPHSGIRGLNAGLHLATWETQARPGKDLTSIGRFIKVSEE